MQKASLSACCLIVLACALPGAASAFQYTASKFQVTRNGAVLFVDNFDGSSTPPAAPNFANGTAASYGLHGSFATPVNGRLTFSSANADVSTANPNTVTNRLKLKTDSDLTLPNKGLKAGASFDALGVFDLAVPANRKESYMVELGDQESGLLGSDMVRLGVYTDGSGAAKIRFWKANNTTAPTPTVTDISAVPLDSSHQQIQLRLSKADASSNAVTASYAYIDNGVVGSETAMSGSTPIFTVNGYTRASLLAFTPIVSAAVSGSNKNLSILANVEIGGSYIGAKGNVYLVAITGSGVIVFNNGSGWVPWQGGNFPAYESGVTLKTHSIAILSNADVSALAGTNTTILAGYGLSDSDMLSNSVFSTVYTVQ
jgi:hypothetical protein